MKCIMIQTKKISLAKGNLTKTYKLISTFHLFQIISNNPCFTVDGISRFDFGQGLIGRRTSDSLKMLCFTKGICHN